MTGLCAKNRNAAVAGLALALGSLAASPVGAEPAALPEAEEADVATLAPPMPEWFFVRGGWGSAGASIFDSKSGKMVGMVSTSRDSDLALDPAGKFYYVSETLWSKGNRGTRQDMISVYDATALKLQAEIAVPGRIIIGGLKTNLAVTDDGKTAFVYNLSPASSVNVIDLVKRKFVRNIELPGCASLMPNAGVGFSALCSDGTLATVAISGTKHEITRTEPFFEPTADPIFSNFAYDRVKKQAVFLSYTGLVYTAAIGAKPSVAAPFSIQAAAGLRPGDAKPLDVNWFPGGGQPMAVHRASGHLYVLMHSGEYWTHKAGGKEIWDVDLAARKVVKRFPLEEEADNIEVTQDAAPMVMVTDRKGTGRIIDAKTWEEKHVIKDAGGGLITVAEPM